MSAMKPLALGVLVWAASLGVVRADPITWPTNFNWVAYFAGENSTAASSSAQFPPTTSPPAAAPPAPSVRRSHRLLRCRAAGSAGGNRRGRAGVAHRQRTGGTAAVTPSVTRPHRSDAPAPAPSGPVDAFINLGNGPYPLASTITTGGAQPWYDSPQITSLFGGQPTAQQIQSFDNAILQRVQQTFSQSGVSVTLTDNPAVPALHTLSLVSNTQSASLSDAIGMTQVGASGFSFIDKIAPSAQSVDQLEWIVAHNISHELMLAFGVPENYDQSGNYIDSKVASWSMMVSPTSTFSPAAAQALAQALATQSQLGIRPVPGRPGVRHGSRADDHRPLGVGGRRRARYAGSSARRIHS